MQAAASPPRQVCQTWTLVSKTGRTTLLKTVSNLKVPPDRDFGPHGTSTASRQRVENEKCDDHTMTLIMAITQNTGCLCEVDDAGVSWCPDQGCTACDEHQDPLNANETRKWRECDSAMTTRAQVADATSFQTAFVQDATGLGWARRCVGVSSYFKASLDAHPLASDTATEPRPSFTAARTSWSSAITSPWM